LLNCERKILLLRSLNNHKGGAAAAEAAVKIALTHTKWGRRDDDAAAATSETVKCLRHERGREKMGGVGALKAFS
jgi:hypothetical protein